MHLLIGLMVAQGKEDSKPEQPQGSPANTNTGFLAPPTADAATPTAAEGGAGMAAEVGNAPTDVPPGIQADTSAVHHAQPTGRRDKFLSTPRRYIAVMQSCATSTEDRNLEWHQGRWYVVSYNM